MNKKIEFNKPFYDDRDFQNIEKCLKSGRDYKEDVIGHLLGATGAGSILLTSGATSAMDLFFAGAALPQNTEVIMPSFTFPSAANAILRAGLKPVFADIDEKTLVLDINDVKNKISGQTSCIMPVHYGGVSMDMDELFLVAEKLGICIFEDAALSYRGYYKGKHLGTMGSAGVISFHSTKNISSDGGGALLLRDQEKIELYPELLANGTNKPSFVRGEVNEYTWQQPGAGTEMSCLTAALLNAQLEKDEEILSGREELWNGYYAILKSADVNEFADLPVVPDYNTNNFHVFYLVFKTAAIREHVRLTLKKSGIQAYIHYKPLHSSPMGQKLGFMVADLPITISVSKRLLRLPMHMHMSLSDVEYVCEIIMAAVKNA